MQELHKPKNVRRRCVFTIFTATYNRCHVLHRVYESILSQTYKCLEWIIVDDGSTDNTSNLVSTWMANTKTFFPIRYYFQTNAHKKTAFNRGVLEANGLFFVTADSDDSFPSDALAKFRRAWKSIDRTKRDGFSGVTGLCVDASGEIVGDRFPMDTWDSNTSESHFIYKIRGEKWGFQRVDVLRKYKYPEEVPGFVPESVVWLQIAAKYQTRYVNDVVRIYNRDASLTEQNRSIRTIAISAYGRCLASKMVLSTQLRFFRNAPLVFLITAARVTRFRLYIARTSTMEWLPREAGARCLVLVMAPLGLLWFLIERLKEGRRVASNGCVGAKDVNR